MKIELIIDEEEKSINVLYSGYNIIKTTLYDEELTNKILKLIIEELEQSETTFTNLKDFLTLK